MDTIMTPLELILDEIRRTPERVVPKNALALPDRAPMRLRCEVLPPSSDPIPEDAPPELAALWRLCGGVEVWKDIIFGQWGLVVHSPSAAACVRAALAPYGWVPEGARVLGSFGGECSYSLLFPDGSVQVYAAEFNEYNPGGASIAEHLRLVLDSPDEPFWERAWRR